MKKKIILYVLVIGSSISCKKKDDAPDFPIEPYIEFRDFQFIQGQRTSNTPNPADTVKVSFYFRDGDFDLGLSYLDVNAPYNSKFYFLETNGSPIPDTRFQNGEFSTIDLLRYHDKEVNLPDTLPSFETPYSCTNWQIIVDNQTGKAIDTLYFKSNPNYYNMDVNVYTVNQSGGVTLFDVSKEFVFPNCNSRGFNSRFPYPKDPNSWPSPWSVKMLSSKEGIMTYSIASVGWKYLFAGQRIKLTVTIQDRALHSSNEIETSELQL